MAIQAGLHSITAATAEFATMVAETLRMTKYVKVQALISRAIRNRKIFTNIKDTGTYLNLGCGSHINRQYCNLDYHWRPGVNIFWDVRKPLPIPDAHISGVFSEHCFEHLEIDDGYRLLIELLRIMIAGSFIRIIVPDGQIYIEEYMKHLMQEKFEMPYGEDVPYVKRDNLAGTYTPMMSINRIFLDEYDHQGHRFIYDFETLEKLLARAGFRQICKVGFGIGTDTKLLLDRPERQIESLYVEARRP